MSDHKYILIADPHAGDDGQSPPFNIHGSMAVQLVSTALEFGYAHGVQAIFDVGDRIQYHPVLGPDDDIRRTQEFYGRTFANSKAHKFHADGNHDLPNASAAELNAVLKRPAQIPTGAFAIATSGTNGVEIEFFCIRIEQTKSGERLKIGRNPVQRTENTEPLSHPMNLPAF
jgi:hypothetical protein